jgi:ribosomal protein S12 methylthiotransferase accessory factor
MMSRFLDRGSDILVVDQTPADFFGDLRCVKVLVPGMLPMTFNHRLRRCVNLSRLYTAPLELGYSAAKNLNEMPHPFP